MDALFKRSQYICIFLLFILFLQQANADLVYITNEGSDTVSVFDTTTRTYIPGSPFPTGGGAGSGPVAIAIHPNGRLIYIANQNTDTISVLDTVTHLPIPGSPFPTGFSEGTTNWIAINPAGTRVYVTSGNEGSVAVLDALSLAPITPPLITGGGIPIGIAVNPTGTRVYIANGFTNDVSVLNASNNTFIAGSPFETDMGTSGASQVVINPAGTRAYVANSLSNNLTIFEGVATDMPTPIAGSPFTSGGVGPFGLAMNSSGTRVYVVNQNTNNISMLDADGLPITTQLTGGILPLTVAVDPEEAEVYVVNSMSGTLTVLDSTTLLLLAAPFPTGGLFPSALAILPIPRVPSIFTAQQKKNDFALVYELFNLLQWGPSSANAVGYHIYRNGVRIATVSSSTFRYEDHNIPKGVTYTYSVTAFDSDGEESPPVTASTP